MKQKSKNAGFSLIELLIVIVIMGIVATVTIPIFTSSNNNSLDPAVSEVVSALRFARSEAMRTRQYHGVTVPDPTHITVFGLEETTTSKVIKYCSWCPSFTVTTTSMNPFDVYHPLDKTLYELDMENTVHTQGIQLEAMFKSSDGTKSIMVFNARGEPVDSDKFSPLSEAKIEVTGTPGTRLIVITPITGRISTQ